MAFLEKVISLFSPKAKTDFGIERRKCIRFRPPKENPLFAEILDLEADKSPRVVFDLSLVATSIQINASEAEHYRPKRRLSRR